jgi:drug/metabolite transporter (DMT)-like permease
MSLLSSVALGQILAILAAASTSVVIQLSALEFEFPAFLISIVYFCLSFCLLKNRRKPSNPIYVYSLTGTFDFLGNFLIVTGITMGNALASQILASFALPFSVLIRYVVFKKKYSLQQLGSLMLCLSAIGCILYSDYTPQARGSLKAGLFCTLGALSYAICNCLEERILAADTVYTEVLGYMGLFGCLLAVSTSLISGELLGKDFTYQSILLVACFSILMIGFYFFMTLFFRKFDASLFNINIAIAPVYLGLILTIQQQTLTLTWLYGLGFLLNLLGSCTYSLG